MRNPNGYGSVYKLSGNRRKPFVAKKTIGWDDNGKQLYQVIGYYAKRKDALQALADFNENPYDAKVKTLTFADVFEAWSRRKYEQVGRSSVIAYNTSYNTCKPLHDIPFVSIKAVHLQDLVLNCGKNYPMRKKLRQLLHQLYKYALENDIIDKDYSQFVDIGKKEETKKKKPFTSDEIEALFNLASTEPFVDTILIMIYTGLRVGELLTIKTQNVDIHAWTIIGGIKTDAGKNRIVPINHKIRHFVEKRVLEGNDYLVTRSNGEPYKYSNYLREHFDRVMRALDMDHKPHECRHTFITMMKNVDADTVALQRIVGHEKYETTLGYTHTDIDFLRAAIDLL